MPPWLGSVLRWTLRILLGAVLAVAAILVAACVYLSTAHGRARLLRAVVSDVNRVLPGTVVARELSRLTPTTVVLHGLGLRARGGNDVVTLDTVRARIGLRALLHGQLVVEHIDLSGAMVDLRNLDDARLGLISAVLEPSADAEPSENGSAAPLIVFGDVRLEDCEVRLPSAFDAAPDAAWVTSLRGRVSIGPTLEIDVPRLRARALRDGLDIGGIRAAVRLVTPGRSHVELAGTLQGVGIEADATLGESGRPLSAWRAAPATLELALHEVTAPAIAALTGASVPLTGSFGARLSLHGTPEAFQSSGTIETPGGPLAVEVDGRELSRLTFVADAERLALERIAEGWPARALSSRLQGTLAPLGPSTPGVRVSIEAATRVDDVALPRLVLHGEHAPDSDWQLHVQLEDGWLSLATDAQLGSDGALRANARGWLAPRPAIARLVALGVGLETPPSGALAPMADSDRLTLRGSVALSEESDLDVDAALDAPRLELAVGRFEQLGATLRLQGRLPRPRIQLKAAWQAAPRGATTLTPGRLELDGGPSRYRFDLHGGAPGALHASGWLERERGGEHFALSAGGRHAGAPWRIEVRPAWLSDTGQLVLPGVEITLDQQRIAAHGQYGGPASRLVLELEAVDLSRALRPLAGPDWAGVVSGRVEARGLLPRPVLSLALRGSGVAVTGAPALDANIDGTFDLDGGRATLQVRAKEHGTREAAPRLDVRLTGDGHFDPRRPWPALLGSGEQSVEIEIARLDSSLLDELLGSSAPGSFDGRGRATLRVAAGVPELSYSLDGRVRWEAQPGTSASAPPTALLKHELRGDGRQLHAALSLDDERGRWISFDGDLALDTESPPTLVALSAATAHDWSRWLRAARWRVALDAAPRPVASLPSFTTLPDLGPAALGVRVAARRDPGAAPAGSLAFQLADASPTGKRHGCVSRLLTTHGHVALEANRFGAALEAFDGPRRLLRAATGGELDLERWLAGEPPSWGSLQVDVEASRLPLDGLPLACGKLRGALTGNGTLRDPLGAARVKADLAIERFSLGSDETVDIDAKLAVDPTRLELSGEVKADGRRSPLSIRWQRAGAPGASPDAPPARELSIELAQLPIAPLLPLEGPISHVSGYVSGQLSASSGAGARALAGTLRLEQVALTVTELAQPLSDIGGEIEFRDGTIFIRRLTGRDGDGELSLDGNLTLHGGRSFDGDFAVVSHEFPLRQAGDVVAQTTATARIRAGFSPELRHVRIALQDFDTWLERNEGTRGLSLEPHPDVKVQTRRGLRSMPSTPPAEEPQRGPAAPRPPLLVEVDAAQQFWVKRADFALKLSANLKIATGQAKTERDSGDVDVTGQLSFERGYMEMLGKSFEVKRGGTLRFTGGTNAVLDLSAQYEDRRTDKLVLVRLQGSADAPKLEFQVDGRKVSAGEAFQAIYGSNASSDDVDPEAQANQIVGALMAGMLTTNMRKRLGAMAPILSVDPADEDRGEQLRAGFELDALIPDFLRDIVTGVYVEGSFSSEKQADQAGDKNVQTGVLIELHFPYNLVSSGRYGPDATWSLDLGWQP